MASRNRKILIPDTVSSACYPSSLADAHISSHTPTQSPAGGSAGVMASPVRELRVGAVPCRAEPGRAEQGGGRICSDHPPPVSVSRERTARPAPLEFLPVFTPRQTERKGGRREGGGGSSGMPPTGEAGQQRKQGKYIFLSGRSPSKAVYTSSILRPRLSCFPAPPPRRLSLCPSLTRTLNPPPSFYPTLIP